MLIFERIAPHADRFSAIFYDKLFAIDGSLQSLFPKDLSTQRHKLTTMLAAVVDLLDQPDQLAAVAEALGNRHAAYGAAPEDFASVGNALIEALADVLGESFDQDAERAWCELYNLLANRMIAAMCRAPTFVEMHL